MIVDPSARGSIEALHDALWTALNEHDREVGQNLHDFIRDVEGGYKEPDWPHMEEQLKKEFLLQPAR